MKIKKNEKCSARVSTIYKHENESLFSVPTSSMRTVPGFVGFVLQATLKLPCDAPQINWGGEEVMIPGCRKMNNS